MFPVTTVDTKKHLSLAGQMIDAATSRARLRGVMGIDLPQHSAFPCQLVLEELCQEAPPSIENTSGESSVGLHHVADLQILNHDRTVALDVVVTELMTKVLPLSSDLSVQVGNAELRFLPVFRSFLPSGDSTLSASKPLQTLLVEARGRNDLAVRIRNGVNHASVDSNDRLCFGEG